ncbi:hypothetical protein LEP1GSC089_0136 [Leptospira interrogans serovar Autumnalis str. LP101]|nr:hypothetical protein LEP1GSC089_0136 [Leptospira interrogans serovar Autumnalis str. LP101]
MLEFMIKYQSRQFLFQFSLEKYPKNDSSQPISCKNLFLIL